jgi:hypothetical protein
VIVQHWETNDDNQWTTKSIAHPPLSATHRPWWNTAHYLVPMISKTRHADGRRQAIDLSGFVEGYEH